MHTYYIILYICIHTLYEYYHIIYICMVLYLTHVDMCIHMSMYVGICIFLTNANHIYIFIYMIICIRFPKGGCYS